MWQVAKVKCDLCGHEWIAAMPVDLDKVECPHCDNMVNYEIIESK